jgi:hypothetical protein
MNFFSHERLIFLAGYCLLFGFILVLLFYYGLRYLNLIDLVNSKSFVYHEFTASISIDSIQNRLNVV